MKKSIAISLFTCCALGLGLSQTVASRNSKADTVGVPQVLDTAHNILASASPEVRIDVLADMVVIANRTKDPHTKEWLEEVERLAERDSDSCRRTRYQARMIEIVYARDPRAALDKLARTDSACPAPLSSVAAVVFPAVFKLCAAECLEDMISTADHLGRLGSYPFVAMLALGQQLKNGEPAANRVFMEALSGYKNVSVLNWSAHRSFLVLVERERTSVSKPAVVEAITAAIMRIKDETTDAGLQHVTLAQNEGAQLYSDRDVVVSELYRLAESVDAGLAKKVIERWPDAPNIKVDESKMTAGVATGGKGPLPKSAQLFLEIAQAKGRLADSGVTGVQNSGLTAPARVALLAWRASEAFSKDQTSASAFLNAAADGLDKLDDPLSKVLTAPYVVDAAIKCGDPNVASKAAQLQFDAALPLLRELQADKPTPLTQTPLYWPLRQTVKALRDLPLAIACIKDIRDDELRARLLVAAAESLSQPSH